MKILYLENHVEFAEDVARRFLKPHQVTIVPSLELAREALATSGFDLLLSDYEVDDGQGDEFVREWCARYPKRPVIAVSSQEDGNAALVKAGASATCSKIEIERIVLVIAGLQPDMGSIRRV